MNKFYNSMKRIFFLSNKETLLLLNIVDMSHPMTHLVPGMDKG